MHRGILVLLAAGLCCLTACSQGDEGANCLKVAMPVSPVSVDPRQGGNTHSQAVTRMVYEGLFRIGQNGEALPALAESYEVSSDGLLYRFRLRESRWSNGDPVTAHDFVRSWQEAMRPDFDTMFAFCFWLIRNAEQVKVGELPMCDLGVRALDERTLEVELDHPAPFFVDHLANAILCPVHEGTAAGEVVNGPYTIQRWLPDSSILLVKNEDYWDAESVQLEQIEYAIIPDAATAYGMFEQGEVDLVGEPLTGLPLETRVALDRRGELESVPVMGIMEYLFNCKREPFDNADIRRAFALAVNRKDLVENIGKVGERVATSILPSQLTLADAPLFQDGDLAAARQLFERGLADKGLDRASFPKVVITYGTLEGQKALAQAVQQQWEEAFGIHVGLEACDWSTLLGKGYGGDYMVVGFLWRSWYQDPTYNLEHVVNTGWENPTYDALLALAGETNNQQLRDGYLREAEALLMREMPLTPIYQFDYQFVSREGVDGVLISSKGLIDLKYVSMEGSGGGGLGSGG